MIRSFKDNDGQSSPFLSPETNGIFSIQLLFSNEPSIKYVYIQYSVDSK